MEVVDLSLPLDEATPIYRGARGYSDPLTRILPWVEVGERRGGYTSRFRVSLLQMGLHTGTHLDAPSHFHPGAPSVDQVSLGSLVGRAAVVDLGAGGDSRSVLVTLSSCRARASAGDALPLILAPSDGGLGLAAVGEIAAWGRSLLAIAGAIDGEDPDCPVTSALLGAGIALATDLDEAAARQVRDGDLLVVAPLPLRGVEGSPCRVLAIRP